MARENGSVVPRLCCMAVFKLRNMSRMPWIISMYIPKVYHSCAYTLAIQANTSKVLCRL